MKLIQQVEDLLVRVARLEGELGLTKQTNPVGRPINAPTSDNKKKRKRKTVLGSKRWNTQQDEALMGMYKRGMTGREMARELGRTAKSVHSRVYILKRGGAVELKP